MFSSFLTYRKLSTGINYPYYYFEEHTMASFPLQKYYPEISRLAYGCMGLGGGWSNTSISKDDIKQAHQIIDKALEIGINFFDHADIYTHGKAEQVFGEVLKQRPDLRQQMILQSKCAIRFEDSDAPGRYDFSRSWIEQSVEGILSRLATEQIDILLLHRPDPLMNVTEVSETLSALHKSGKVKHFGVSNMHRYQMELLNAHLEQPLIVNQLEMSLSKHDWLEQGVTVGMPESANVGFTPGTLEYCQLQNIQIQAWGSLSQGLFSGQDVNDKPEHIQETAKLVTKLAEQYSTSCESIVLAWLMRHPVAIQPVIGTTNLNRIQACADSVDVAEKLTREHWYQLYVTARGNRLP